MAEGYATVNEPLRDLVKVCEQLNHSDGLLHQAIKVLQQQVVDLQTKVHRLEAGTNWQQGQNQ
jgi:hypothetical protein